MILLVQILFIVIVVFYIVSNHFVSNMQMSAVVPVSL